MSKYKRWILLLTALTVFVVRIESLKATSLIHAGKFTKLLNQTTSTTSTTEGAPGDKLKEAADEYPQEEEGFRIVNGTKIALTGIPQIDYVWDPNLPRELNGFNLSTYPFIDSMPAEEDIGFDCDDKINGFYASIKYGCQIYHHCLYGVRSDFICANFTAFDQKTFICHFASEVDCKNSYKYWNRNDDLYKATTEKPSAYAAPPAPLFDRNLYKRPAPGSSGMAGGTNRSPQQKMPAPLFTKESLDLDLNNAPASAPLRPAHAGAAVADYDVPAQRPSVRPGTLRRPYRRRRPQVDYYYYDDEYEDEVYDDRSRRRQQRPRNRRPIYDDYRDTRRPHDDFDDYEYDRRPYRNRNRSESRKSGDDRRKQEDRRFDDRRRPNSDDRKPIEDRKRPEEERRSYDDRRFSDDRRQTDDRKRQDEERSQSDDRKSSRRKNYDDPIDDRRRERIPDRSEPTEKRQATDETYNDDKPVKAVTQSLFDRPRPSPKISRPSENKFSRSKPTEKPLSAEDDTKKDEEYYEEYDDAPLSSPSSSSTTTSTTTTTTTTTTPRSTTTTVRTSYSPRRLKTLTTTSTLAPETIPPEIETIEYYDDDYSDVTATTTPVESSTFTKSNDRAALFSSRNDRNRNENSHSTTTFLPQPSTPDNFRLNRFKNPSDKLINQTAVRDNALKSSLPYVEETSPIPSTSRKPLPSISYNSKKFANQQTLFEPTTTETPKASSSTLSYSQRFLSRNNEQPAEQAEQVDERDQKYLMRIIKRPFLPSRGGNPYKGRGLQPVGPASLLQSEQALDNAQFTAEGSEPAIDNTQHQNFDQSQLKSFDSDNHKTTLEDIYNEEYDVELNDALNPMLKPLTSSRGISGFSFSSLPNDGYRAQSIKSIQKAEPPIKTTTTTTEAPQYEYEEVEYDYK